MLPIILKRRIYTDQKQTPTGGHEGKNTNNNVLHRHVGERDQGYQDGNKSKKYQSFDEPKHKLKICAEFSSSN